MEEEEEKTKKGGGINLDWDKLFPKNEAEPPQLLVVHKNNTNNNKKRKMGIVQIDDDDEKCQNLEQKNNFVKKINIEENNNIEEKLSLEERFRGVSDREMVERVERMKKSVYDLKLRDGGEKYVISIKRHEDELERRKLVKSQKDDDKCKRPGQSHYLSCSGKSDGTQIEKPVQENNSSTFSTLFLQKMEPNAHNPIKSTLDRCDRQKMKSNPHHSSAGRHQLGSSSRQTPFRCPSTLSTDGDKDIIKEDDKAPCSVSVSVYQSKEDVAEESSKMNSSKVRLSCDRKRHDTVVFVDEDEAEIATVDQQSEGVDECKKDPTRIYYPSRDDAESVEIHYSDLDCLASEAYLTSTIINFYIRYLLQHIYSISKDGEDYHFFNTYFYEKLRKAILKKNDMEAFTKIRRWWKGVKLFEKAYIFLPIHENFHWSLVIICIPDKEDGIGPSVLHLDSLGLHSSKLIFENIKRFLIGEWEFLMKNEALPDPPFPDNIWKHFPRRISVKAIEVPQQSNDYDCGLFVLFFIERFIDKAPRRMKKEDLAMLGKQWFQPVKASLLREKIQHLLQDEFNKENG